MARKKNTTALYSNYLTTVHLTIKECTCFSLDKSFAFDSFFYCCTIIIFIGEVNMSCLFCPPWSVGLRGKEKIAARTRLAFSIFNARTTLT